MIRHGALIRSYTDAFTRTVDAALGIERPVPRPVDTFWDDVVGIPLDEWMNIRTRTQLRMAIARRTLRRLKGFMR